jgi:predicted AAA+ superfamily ATPase
MNYIERKIEGELWELVKMFPVITITGPRQSGKTTLAKHCFPDLPYINLEDPDQRLLAITDARKFLNRIPEGAIIDEVQHAPELLSYIQGIVDENREKIRFILTGSNQFQMMAKITQSLAGRTALLKLLPFSLDEIPETKKSSTDLILFRGFYPNVLLSDKSPTRYYRNYFETYIQKDLHQLINVKDSLLFQRFMHLCASRTGSLLNISSIANELGVSPKTVQSWISILETSYIIFLLQPYFKNIGKRLIKAPKLYFYDTGLAAYLLGIESETHMMNHPLRGSLFENLVVVETMKFRLNGGLDPHLYFYRDSNHFEIDMIFETAGNLVPIEIKSAQTFHMDFLKGFQHFNKVFGDRITRRVLVYDGKQEMTLNETELVNFRNATQLVFQDEVSEPGI